MAVCELDFTLAMGIDTGRPHPSSLYTVPGYGLCSVLPRLEQAGGSPTLNAFTPGLSPQGAQIDSGGGCYIHLTTGT